MTSHFDTPKREITFLLLVVVVVGRDTLQRFRVPPHRGVSDA